MAQYDKRIQFLASREQYRLLQEEAARRGTSLGAAIRRAVDEVYARRAKAARLRAARRLVRGRLPVADWPQMEEEIIQGMLKDE